MPNIADLFNGSYTIDVNNGCWVWNDQESKKNKYGQLYFKGKRYVSHRLSYELFRGVIPKGNGYHASCVNPDHLFLGSQKDNMIDKKNKGRCPKTYKSKTQKEKIYKVYFTAKELQSRWGISHQAFSDMKKAGNVPVDTVLNKAALYHINDIREFEERKKS